MGCIQSKTQQEKPINFDNASNIQKSKKPKCNSRHSRVLKQISSIPIFQMLSELQRIEVAKFLKEKVFIAGDTLMTEGEKGDEFFLLCSGECEVFIGKRKVSALQQNDYCGEQALLNSIALRTATVRCIEETICLVMDRNTFESVQQSTSIKFRRMHLALSEDDDEDDETGSKNSEFEQDLQIRDNSVVEWLATCVQKNMLFSDMQLSDIQEIVKHMKNVCVKAEAVLCSFFIVFVLIFY